MRNINGKFLHSALSLFFFLSFPCYAEVTKLDQCQIEVKTYSKKIYQKDIYFLNGLISSEHTFTPLTRELRRFDFNLKTLSLPSTGKSKVDGDHNWTNIGNCLKKYFNDKKNFILVMHDFSVAIMMPLLSKLNSLPSGIVIINGLIRPSEYQFIHPYTLYEGKIGSKVTGQIYPKFLFKKNILSKLLHNEAKMSDEDFDLIYEQTIGNNSSEIAKLVQSFPKDPSYDQLIKQNLRNPHIKQLIIWGIEDDILINQLQFLDETSNHPYRTTYFVKNAKHFPMWEHPLEIGSVIKTWIESNKM